MEAALHARIDALERRCRELDAYERIRACVYRVCRALDRLDRELLANGFHDDARVDYGTIYRGGVAGFLDVAMSFQGAMRDTHHQVGNILIELGDAEARVESYVTAHHVLEEAGFSFELVVGARYLDRFERRNGEWRIAFRTEVLDWARRLPIGERWFEEQAALPKGRRDRGDASYAALMARPEGDR